jgi:preprotein translocase subunit YajC
MIPIIFVSAVLSFFSGSPQQKKQQQYAQKMINPGQVENSSTVFAERDVVQSPKKSSGHP